jgi:hypothetical protein
MEPVHIDDLILYLWSFSRKAFLHRDRKLNLLSELNLKLTHWVFRAKEKGFTMVFPKFKQSSIQLNELINET